MFKSYIIFLGGVLVYGGLPKTRQCVGNKMNLQYEVFFFPPFCLRLFFSLKNMTFSACFCKTSFLCHFAHVFLWHYNVMAYGCTS